MKVQNQLRRIRKAKIRYQDKDGRIWVTAFQDIKVLRDIADFIENQGGKILQFILDK